MDNIPQLISGPVGQFLRKKNSLVYFHMPPNAFTDKQRVSTFLDTICKLDDSGSARVIVIHQGCPEFSPEAQLLLFNNKIIAGLACIARTNAQRLSAERFLGFAKSLSATFPVQVFYLLRKPRNGCSTQALCPPLETFIHSRKNFLTKLNDVELIPVGKYQID